MGAFFGRRRRRSRAALVLAGTLAGLRLAACFVPGTEPATVAPTTNGRWRGQRWRQRFPGRSVRGRLSSTPQGRADDGGDDGGLFGYWEKNGGNWEQMLRILDVKASYETGSLDGIMPSGRASRAAPNERLISLPRALELFEEDERNILVRRRFRLMKVDELRPRWERVMKKRDELVGRGAWEGAVSESERYREFQKSLIDGTVESADASPAFSRAVVTLLSPALGAAARQRNRSDGGIQKARAELLAAGSTPEERWVTSALLAELEEELEAIISAAASATTVSSPSFVEEEAAKEIQDAGSGFLYGVLLALITSAFVASLQ